MKKIILAVILSIIGISFNDAWGQCALNPTPLSTNICADGVSTINLTRTGAGCGTGTETWVSTVTGVATVAGTGAGTATVTSAGGIGSTTIIYRVNGVTKATLSITGVALPTPGTISTSGTFDVCVGSNITVTSSGDPGGVWTSSNTSEATVGASSGVVTGVGAGTPDITYTVTNVYGCTDDTWQAVNVHALPTVTITSGASNVCHTGTPTETITATPSLGSWSASNANASVGAFTGVVTGANPGSVNIFYHFTDANNCTNFATHPMTVDPTPNAGTLTGTFHTWPSLITTLTHTGQTGGTWGTSAAGVATVTSTGATTADVTGVSMGVANINYTVANTCGSPSTATVQVTVNPFPTMPSPSTIIDDPLNGTTRTIAGFNTAMIRCTPVSGSGAAGHDYVYAFSHWDGSGSNVGEVIVVDNTNYPGGSGTGYATGQTSGNPINTPDVVIVNEGTNPDVYLVAVAYPTTSGVVVDIWEYDASANTMNTTPDYTQTEGTYLPSVVHIDAMADFANPVNGLPDCQYAALAWDDGSFNTIIAETNLRGGSGLISGAVGLSYGYNPDVAGIMRNVGGTHHVALIATTSSAPVAPYYKLYYAEYDFTAGAVARQATLDSSTYPFEPRIDANDNENNNDTTSPTTSYFKIAAQVYDGFNYNINTYDNLLFYPTHSLDYWTSSNVVSFPTSGGYATPPYHHYSPSVAMVGPNSGGTDPDGTAYMVTHMTDDLTGNEAMFAEIIPYTVPNVLVGGAYYWVSDDPAIGTTADHLSASAPTCNKVDGAAIVAWYDNNGGIDDIKCRISGCCYAFKQDGQEPEIKSIPLNKGWRVYPNPAAGELTISNVGSKGGSYTITDVLGRTLLQGSISGSSVRADVGALAPGMYVVAIRGANGENVVKKFVKE